MNKFFLFFLLIALTSANPSCPKCKSETPKDRCTPNEQLECSDYCKKLGSVDGNCSKDKGCECKGIPYVAEEISPSCDKIEDQNACNKRCIDQGRIVGICNRGECICYGYPLSPYFKYFL